MNCIQTLGNVVIIDATRANFLPCSCTNQGFVAFDVAQVKERSYHD